MTTAQEIISKCQELVDSPNPVFPRNPNPDEIYIDVDGSGNPVYIHRVSGSKKEVYDIFKEAVWSRTRYNDDDGSAVALLKNGEIMYYSSNLSDSTRLPSQSSIAAYIISDGSGFTFWNENMVDIELQYDKEGILDGVNLCFPEDTRYEEYDYIKFSDIKNNS